MSGPLARMGFRTRPVKRSNRDISHNPDLTTNHFVHTV